MAQPPAEVTLTVDDVDRMIATQYPSLRRPLELAAHGWDTDVFRLGDDLAVRLPRREQAAPLVVNEQRWLPELAARLPVPVPVPIAVGTPTDVYPWAWSIVPWFPGVPAIRMTPEERDPLADQLAAIIVALSVPAPADAPHNPYRGVPLAWRDETIRARFVSTATIEALLPAWESAMAADAWAGPDVWVHGDLHPANVLVDAGRVTALIDFGDVCAGDPAYDLAAAWLFFTSFGRDAFVARLAHRFDDATWTRARGWAAAVAALAIGAPDNGFGEMGAHAVRQLAGRGR